MNPVEFWLKIYVLLALTLWITLWITWGQLYEGLF